MWTCGIDIATQQATPATINSAISVLEERPSVPRVPLDTAPAASAGCDGAGRRIARMSGSMATAQIRPMPIWVVRQPCVEMKYWISGGQIAPER